jgi:opacity protein-like surface antigen
MGLGYTTTPKFNDFVRNEVFNGLHDSVKSFSVGLEIFGGMEYELTKSFSLRLDYSYFFKSKTYYKSFYIFDYYYFIHQPFLMAQYNINHTNYRFDFSAGAGYQFGQLQRTLNNTEYTYSTSGPAIRGEVRFSARFTERLNTYLSGFVNGAFLNTFQIQNSGQQTQDVSLSGFGLGIRLGLSYNIF